MLITIRSHSGEVLEYDSIDTAIQSFITDDGYRLSFFMNDGTELHIRKAEYTQDHPATNDKNHFMHNYISRVFDAEARVTLILPQQKDAEIINLFD
jgi:hypothetical protein